MLDFSNPDRFRQLVGGQTHGLTAALLRTGLGAVEVPYSLVVSVRNLLYDYGVFRTRRLGIPILSVGNLTLGGTGKTPMVAWLCRFFLDSGCQPGIISRGYGKTVNGVNDEFLELASRFPDVSHRQNPNRVAAAEEFLRHRGADVLILDDAFQHRRIARDFDVVLLDALEPFGFEHVFPRGTLRESITSLRRAHAVLLSRADGISEAERHRIRDRVLRLAPHVVWGEVAHVPCSLVSPSGQEHDVSQLRGRRVLAFCGIGNPNAFYQTLERNGAEIVEQVSFPDHHRFTSSELHSLRATAAKLRVDGTVCTMKDLVKIDGSEAFGDLSLHGVAVRMQFLSGETEFCERLQGKIGEAMKAI